MSGLYFKVEIEAALETWNGDLPRERWLGGFFTAEGEGYW